MPCSNARPSLRMLPWLAAGLLAAALPAAAGKIYQWQDAKGITHYADSPPPDHAHKSRAIQQQQSPAMSMACESASTPSAPTR